MGWFSHSNDNERFVLLVDVGSGSVGVAISHEQRDQRQPTLLWSHREYMLIKSTDEAGSYSLREINTAIINAFLRLGSDGLRQFRETYPKHRLAHIQVSISAPWTYTVTKNVQYSEEHPFRITKTLVDELTETANQKVMEMALEQSILASKGLTTIESRTIGVIANDYPLTKYSGVEAKNITLVHVTAVTHQKILDIIAEAQSKVIPRTSISAHSFMYVFYDVMRDATPDTTEACLIDVTNEATEMAILRDNLMLHTSHIPYGAATLARDIATATGIPTEEAFAYIRGGESFILDKLSKDKRAKLDAILANYEQHLVELFQQTGDTLAIPKTLFMHSDTDSEPFFKEHLLQAARQATHTVHTVHTITSKLLTKSEHRGDTAIILSANYSHKHWQRGDGD